MVKFNIYYNSEGYHVPSPRWPAHIISPRWPALIIDRYMYDSFHGIYRLVTLVDLKPVEPIEDDSSMDWLYSSDEEDSDFDPDDMDIDPDVFRNIASYSDQSRVGGSENSTVNEFNSCTLIQQGTRYKMSNQSMTSSSAIDIKKGKAFTEISNMVYKLHLGDSDRVINKANALFIQVLAMKTRGRKFHHMYAACLYLACNIEQVPRTLKEISSVSRSTPEQIHKAGRFFKKNKINLEKFSLETYIPIPQDYIPRWCSDLGLQKYGIKEVATHIANKVVTMNILPRTAPISIAAAAIYMATQHSNDSIVKKTQKDIAKSARIAADTIGRTYKLMKIHKNKLLPEDS